MPASLSEEEITIVIHYWLLLISPSLLLSLSLFSSEFFEVVCLFAPFFFPDYCKRGCAPEMSLIF